MLIYTHFERSYRHEWAPVAIFSSYYYQNFGVIDPCPNNPTLTNILAINTCYSLVLPPFSRMIVTDDHRSGWRAIFLDPETH